MKNLTDTWSEKSDKETLQKQVDLDNLKTVRTKDLERYQYLAKLVRILIKLIRKYFYCIINNFYHFNFQFSEYEKVVIEDRIEKDRERIRAEQEKLELEASLKVKSRNLIIFIIFYTAIKNRINLDTIVVEKSNAQT